MRRVLLIVLLFVFGNLFAQDGSIWVKGKVINASTNEPLFLVQISNNFIEKGISSDLNGEFNILVDKNHLLRFRALGFDAKTVTIVDYNNEGEKSIVVELDPHVFYIEDVTVTGVMKKDDPASQFSWWKKSDYTYSVYDGIPINNNYDLRLMTKKERAIRKYGITE